jgi:hypothetical protein
MRLLPFAASPAPIRGHEGRGSRVAQVRLSGVSKRWGAEPAVDKVSFTAEAGMLVVIGYH